MRKPILFLLLMLSTFSYAVPYYVRVNGKTDYAASAAGTQDFQGRDQYYATCIQLAVNDVITCYDEGNNAEWAIQALDQYGAYQSFTATTTGLKCNKAGMYNIYLKFKYKDDQIYVEDGKECTEPVKPYDPTDPVDPGYQSSAPAQYPGVMLQAFYWDSWKDQGYGRTKWIDLLKQAEEMGQWFDLIWLPPSAFSEGGTGYHPRQYSNQDGDWGTKKNLLPLIETFHQNGARVIADIVINHCANSSGWCSFYTNDFGAYGKFSPDASWICSTDEINYDTSAGSCYGKATGAKDDGYGDEANYTSARDWDHTNPKVQEMCRAYLKWLKDEIGYDGWRYDYCKGFHNSHINDYNKSSEAFFSVMEMWDGNPDVLMSHLNDAGYNTTTFDFGTKYDVFNNGIAADNYNLRGKGLLGRGKGRYAVTFIDSHDGFQRNDNEFCGANNSMKYPDKVLQCNAYLLAMPGTPCIFWPHWVTFKEDIKKMINARYKAGVHNESAVSDESGNGYYKATVTGTNGTLRLLLGPNSGYNNTPSGYTLGAKGTNWAIYYKLTNPRGDKNTERQPIHTAIPQIQTEPTEKVATKVMENGQLIIIRDGVRYDAIGRKIAF